MATSPDLGIPYIAAQQGQPEVTHNDAINMLAGMMKGALDIGLNAPPVSPADGDVHIIGTVPTGAWAGEANKLAYWASTSWIFIPGLDSDGAPIAMGARQAGLSVYVRDDNATYHWTGTAWISGAIVAADVGYIAPAPSYAANVEQALDELYAGSGGGGGSVYPFPGYNAMSPIGTLTFSHDNFGARFVVFPENCTLDSVMVYSHAANGGVTLTPAIYTVHTDGTIHTLVTAGPSLVGVPFGLIELPLTTPVTITAGDTYWVGMQVSGSDFSPSTMSNLGTVYFANVGAPPSSAGVGSYDAIGFAVWAKVA